MMGYGNSIRVSYPISPLGIQFRPAVVANVLNKLPVR